MHEAETWMQHLSLGPQRQDFELRGSHGCDPPQRLGDGHGCRDHRLEAYPREAATSTPGVGTFVHRASVGHSKREHDEAAPERPDRDAASFDLRCTAGSASGRGSGLSSRHHPAGVVSCRVVAKTATYSRLRMASNRAPRISRGPPAGVDRPTTRSSDTPSTHVASPYWGRTRRAGSRGDGP